MRISIWIVLLFSIVFGSCGDDTPAKTEYKDGVIVVNQGAFLTGTGTLTFKGRGSANPVQNIFSSSNEGALLGNIAQSMIEHDGKNYISINNGGKIVVTDNDDFTLLDTIGTVFQSRYFVSNGDKLYVSAWGESGSTGSVQEIDTDLDKVQMSNLLGSGPEGMIIIDNLLYIAKGGGFGSDSTLVIMDTNDNSIINTLVVGDNPELMVKDNDDNIYLICNGIPNFSDPSLGTLGKLLKIKDQQIITSIELPSGSNRLAIDKENGFIYFNRNGFVVKVDIKTDFLEAFNVHEGFAFALGFDDVDQQLYVGDAKDFASQGEVFVYSSEDILVESFQCGIIPSYFHFK